MKHTQFKTIIFLLTMSIIWSCSPAIEEPEVIDERTQMLEVMDYTAQVVSQVMISNDARQEILSYALEKSDGEVDALFRELLIENPSHQSLINSKKTGSFAQNFRPKAQGYQFYKNSFNKSSSADEAISDLENYLKKHNLTLYGPYLAENHSDSNKPITVSFDPLDDSKTANHGYIITPKNSNVAKANHGGIDAPRVSLDDNYELTRVAHIDDTYAFENPTVFITPYEGTIVVTSSNSYTSTNNSTRNIDCRELSEDDIIQFSMPKYQLNGNLRKAPWNRNLLDLWFISGDDISVNQANLTAILDDGTAKIWRSKQVSKENGRKKNWLNSDVTFVDTNWSEDEVNQYMIIAYKSGNDGGEVDGTISTIVDENGVETQLNVNVSVELDDKFESFHQLSYDRCGTLAIYKTDLGNGLHEGLAVIRADKMNFTLNAIKR